MVTIVRQKEKAIFHDKQEEKKGARKQVRADTRGFGREGKRTYR